MKRKVILIKAEVYSFYLSFQVVRSRPYQKSLLALLPVWQIQSKLFQHYCLLLEDPSHAVGGRVKNNRANVKKKETTCLIKTGWKPSFLSFLGLDDCMKSEKYCN